MVGAAFSHLTKERRDVSEKEIEQFLGLKLMLKEGDTFIAWAPILDETGEGDTEEEAVNALKEAVRMRLEDKNMTVPHNIKFQAVILAQTRVEPVVAHVETAP